MRWGPRRPLKLLVAAAAVLASGCPAPTRYAVERPGLSCDRASRVAYRTMLELGYTVTSVVPATTVRTGEVAGKRRRPEGEETARVLIACDARGAVIQPVEDALFPTYEFSRVFGYSFKALVQRPDVEEPRAELGLQVQVRAIPAHEAILDLGGDPTVGEAVPVRVTIRNRTDRVLAVDPARLDLVPAEGSATAPLAGEALAAALAPGVAGDRVRAELLVARRIPAQATVTGFLVYPPGLYREARIAIEDVETGETEGFVAPLQ
jgi:hypothetical protein